MSKLFLSVACLSFLTFCFGQKPKAVSQREREWLNEEQNHQCRYLNKLSPLQRSGIYPFSRAANIQIASFLNYEGQYGKNVTEGTIPLKGDTVDYTKLEEVRTLTQAGIDSLTDLLYNYSFAGPTKEVWITKCYMPKNAVLFRASLGGSFAYIELCFDCGGHRSSSNDTRTGDDCIQKVELLKSFFAQRGIEIGTKTETSIQELPAMEEKIVDTILKLKEVRQRAAYIKKQTKGKRRLTIVIYERPLKETPYYWVKAGEDNGISYVTHFNFFVYPKPFRIMFYDTVNDKEISLNQWQKK